jgi:hypothetical protein
VNIRSLLTDHQGSVSAVVADSPDPYLPNPGNTQSFNPYSYVNNNPLSFVDPQTVTDS